jgi:hypothetical protein
MEGEESRTVEQQSFDHTALVARRVWSQHLGQPINDDDDLLALGAHSLIIALVANALRNELDVSVPLELCFEWPLFMEYAAAVHRLRDA